MIPLGAISLRETAKSDYTGACGRAAIHDVRVRKLLGNAWQASTPFLLNALVTPTAANGHAYQCTTAGSTGSGEPAWPVNGGNVTDGTVTWKDVGKVFVADPLGMNASPSLTGWFGTSSVQRVNLYCTTSPTAAANLCRWQDDLTFVRPEEIKSATPPPAGSRPLGQYIQTSGAVQVPQVDAGAFVTANPLVRASFSWLLTASPSTLQPGLYNVAVAVCSQRNIASEQTCTCRTRAVRLRSRLPTAAVR